MKPYHKLLKKLKKPIFTCTRSYYENIGRKKLKRNQILYQTLTKYLNESKSTGCNYYDYWYLYNFVRQNKPKEILECGTGASTLAMAHALKENEQDGQSGGRITSMEDVEFWYQHAQELIPNELKPYIDMICSPKVEYCHSIFRGVGYEEIPGRDYQFIFIDGPETTTPSDQFATFDFDLINIVKKANQPVYAVVDKRVTTCYVFQKVFGADKVKFDPRCDLGFVGPVIQNDIKSKIGTASFSYGFKLVGRTRLDFYLRPPKKNNLVVE
jgi:hypothetical protein